MRLWASVRCKSQANSNAQCLNAPRIGAAQCPATKCPASYCPATQLHRSPVTNKPATHLGQPYVVKPGFLPRSLTFRYARCRIAAHSLSVYE